MGSACSSCSDTKDKDDSNRRTENTKLMTDQRGSSISETNEVGDSVSGTEGQDNWLNDLKLSDCLFDKLSKFLKSLPANSKKHIWEHGVKAKSEDGKKISVDKTTNEGQIARLLCDCVIVYVKYIDRKREPLSRKSVLPHVQPASSFIYKLYGDLSRDLFENDKTYFSNMLEKYQQSLPTTKPKK